MKITLQDVSSIHKNMNVSEDCDVNALESSLRPREKLGLLAEIEQEPLNSVFKLVRN